MDETELETVLREAQMGSAVAFGEVYGEHDLRMVPKAVLVEAVTGERKIVEPE